MNWTVKLGVIAAVIVAIAILLYAAVSDNIFFIKQPLTHDNVVYDTENGYTLKFYKDGKAIELANLTYDITNGNDDLANITFQLSYKINHKIDSLNLTFKMLQPPQALMLENLEGYSPPPLIRTPTDDNSSVIFCFSDLEGSKGSLFETIYLDFSLNLSQIDPLSVDQLILDISLSMHEESIFKILRYKAGVSVQLDIPSLLP